VLYPTYSIVIPIYNEAANLPEMYRRLVVVLEQLDGPTELILVDDGSRDRSLAIIRELHENDSRIRYVSFARNFGHQTAVTAGLHYAKGKAIAVMDADLQDPPELVLEMADRWREGYKIIYAQRISRQQESWFKRLTAYGFYRVLRCLADVNIPADTGDFCLMDRQVVDVLNAMPERNRYIRGLRAWSGFAQTAVTFDRSPRFAGEPQYTFAKSLSLAINGIISFSRIPLRLATYTGLGAAAIAIIMIAFVLYWRLVGHATALMGYTLVTIALFFLGSVQLLCLGILGEYIGRIYEEVKGRPIYTIKETSEMWVSALTRPDLTRPDLTRPDLTRPDLTRPDLTRPDLMQSEPVSSGITRPDASQLEATHSESLRSEP
jgi:polyisoprenyl-phosphate glycosyltransferase